MIKIITDSICDLKSDLIEKYEVEVLPLRVRLGGEQEYLDRVEVDPPRIWDAMHRGIAPQTTQVPPSVTASVFERCAAAGMDFIYVAFSAVLSGCCHVATLVSSELKEKYPKVKMGIINSKAGSFGQGSMVLQLAHAAAKGVSFEELMNRGTHMAEHVEIFIGLGDMKWLVLGGRVNKLLGKTGSMLDIRPIVHIDRQGYLKVVSAVRGQKRMIQSVCDKSLELLREFPEQLIGLSYSEEYSSIEQAMEYMKDRLGNPRYYIQPIGCALTAHCGLEGLGVQFFNTKIEPYYYD